MISGSVNNTGKFDLFYEEGYLTITNEAYGGTARCEFELFINT